MSQINPGDGTYQCECGQFFSSKFCPNCGKQRTEKESFQSSPKFCVNSFLSIIRSSLTTTLSGA